MAQPIRGPRDSDLLSQANPYRSLVTRCADGPNAWRKLSRGKWFFIVLNQLSDRFQGAPQRSRDRPSRAGRPYAIVSDLRTLVSACSVGQGTPDPSEVPKQHPCLRKPPMSRVSTEEPVCRRARSPRLGWTEHPASCDCFRFHRSVFRSTRLQAILVHCAVTTSVDEERQRPTRTKALQFIFPRGRSRRCPGVSYAKMAVKNPATSARMRQSAGRRALSATADYLAVGTLERPHAMAR